MTAQRTPSTPAAAPAGIYLQVGAFSQPLNAQALANQIHGSLGNRDLPPPVIEQARNLYRVKIGPYASRDAALQAVQAVAKHIGIVPNIIVP